MWLSHSSNPVLYRLNFDFLYFGFICISMAPIFCDAGVLQNVVSITEVTRFLVRSPCCRCGLLLSSLPRSECRPLHEQSFAIVFYLRRISTDYLLTTQSTSWCYHANAPSVFLFTAFDLVFTLYYFYLYTTSSFSENMSIKGKLSCLYSL